MNLKIFIIDAFTHEPFYGNPAAVCLVPYTVKLSENMMLRIAAEMNLSETAFVQPTVKQQSFIDGSIFSLRWFTPATEVPLCGHATLATSAVLFKILGNLSNKISYETLSGTLYAEKRANTISLDFPLNPTEKQSIADYADIVKACNVDNLVQEVAFSPGTGKLLVHLNDDISRLQFEAIQVSTNELLASRCPMNVHGVILTVKGDEKLGYRDSSGQAYDFVSRYFAPWVGIAEDPVTGSAHTVLASYWSQRLHKTELYAHQCSQRGGELWLSVRTDGRVDIAGQAAVVLHGELTLPC